MRPITKLLLLVVVAFIVYLIWPRNPDIKNFDPSVLAGLDVKTWVAEKRGKSFDALKARFKIYSSQYKFPPVASFRIAQTDAAGIEALGKSFPKVEGEAPEPMEENRAILAFTQKFVTIKKQVGGDFDPDALAREEVSWRSREHSGAPDTEVAQPIARIFAAIYGGDPADFDVVAQDIAAARALIFSENVPPDVTDPVQTAQDYLREALTLLKEIAQQAPSAEPQEE